MTGAKTVATDSLEQQTKSLPMRRPYPGATLKHLGSVRDVTLAKTKLAFEAGPRHA